MRCGVTSPPPPSFASGASRSHTATQNRVLSLSLVLWRCSSCAAWGRSSALSDLWHCWGDEAVGGIGECGGFPSAELRELCGVAGGGCGGWWGDWEGITRVEAEGTVAAAAAAAAASGLGGGTPRCVMRSSGGAGSLGV